ncbi:MAG: tRNA (adenosine(37)-N6)-threonylcarbamoyltransferase complex transferase subunit TsaD [Coprobacillus sp.]|nr:tRNA (adenosine(37)-N6)-threonylcarbamoyltransferase complex transferase subunit TsaD [Coprobacillus sp.]
MITLGIESSCDETGVAIVKDGKLLSNVVSSQADIHAKYGGVMPEVASRLHAENIIFVLKEALEKANVTLEEVDAFAVTRGPGLIGALHVGMQAAKTLSMLYDKPLIPVHHLAGHIYANEFVSEMKFPLLAIVVSGGNSELVLMKEDLDFEVLGETRDDAIGECFDKVARVLGFPYPGGAMIDEHAKNGRHTYNLPTPLKGVDTLDFSFSGLKTNVINLVHNLEQKGESVNIDDMCRSVEEVAVELVVNKALTAIKRYGITNVVVCGGVSANSYLREKLKKELDKRHVSLSFPPMWCCTDNAAMIAKLGEKLYLKGIKAPLTISPDPNWRIEDYKNF